MDFLPIRFKSRPVTSWWPSSPSSFCLLLFRGTGKEEWRAHDNCCCVHTHTFSYFFLFVRVRVTYRHLIFHGWKRPPDKSRASTFSSSNMRTDKFEHLPFPSQIVLPPLLLFPLSTDPSFFFFFFFFFVSVTTRKVEEWWFTWAGIKACNTAAAGWISSPSRLGEGRFCFYYLLKVTRTFFFFPLSIHISDVDEEKDGKENGYTEYSARIVGLTVKSRWGPPPTIPVCGH